uniref:Pre-mRNA 3'-end-processing factor FIP1 n=1 Tax=Cyclopterus lumpus TaxID=8103 RepID=A0A8C2WKJ0_CYCLU
MSAEEADKQTATDASAGDEEEEWLYGGKRKRKKRPRCPSPSSQLFSVPFVCLPPPPPPSSFCQATGEGEGDAEGDGAGVGEDVDSDSDSDDDDDDVRVTIGDIKTGAPQYTKQHVHVHLTCSDVYYFLVASKMKGVDLDAPGSINGVPVLEADVESFEEKPWRKPGADLSDYFNYGFNEDTWKAYCEKQKRLRMGLEVSTIGSVTSKITVQQGRTGNDKDMSSLPIHTSKPDFTSPLNMYNPPISQVPRISPPQWPPGPPPPDMSYYTKTSGTIDVIGGGTATISRVEGRRRHNLEGNNIQVHRSNTDTLFSTKLEFNRLQLKFPTSSLLDQFLQTSPHLRSSLLHPMSTLHPRSSPHPVSLSSSYHFSAGLLAHTLPPCPEACLPPWPPMMDNTKPWDYYARRDDKREKERERPRERTHEREREREHSPSAISYTR